MRVMVIMKATKDSVGQGPAQQRADDSNGQLQTKSSSKLVLAGEGLKPTLKGKWIRFSGSKRTVIDGPRPRN